MSPKPSGDKCRKKRNARAALAAPQRLSVFVESLVFSQHRWRWNVIAENSCFYQSFEFGVTSHLSSKILEHATRPRVAQYPGKTLPSLRVGLLGIRPGTSYDAKA